MLNRKAVSIIGLAISFAITGKVAIAASDVNKGVVSSVEQQVIELQARGLTPQESIAQIAKESPDLVLSAVMLLLSLHPEQADVILEAAYTVAPGQAEAITQLASKLGFSEMSILTAAISAGIDPTQIAQPTAAGNLSDKKNRSDKAASNTPDRPANPGVGSGGSGSGGGTASPS